MENVEFTTRPVTLREHILVQRIIDHNDWEAMFQILLLRSNMSEEQVYGLDDVELTGLMGKLSESVTRSLILMQMGLKIDD